MPGVRGGRRVEEGLFCFVVVEGAEVEVEFFFSLPSPTIFLSGIAHAERHQAAVSSPCIWAGRHACFDHERSA